MPWSVLLKLIKPMYPWAEKGRPPYQLTTMLRERLMQNRFGLSDPAMEEALYEVASMRQFARLSLTRPTPDETTILNFGHRLDEYGIGAEIFARLRVSLARKDLLLKRGGIHVRCFAVGRAPDCPGA